jgi:hypothetical protein
VKIIDDIFEERFSIGKELCISLTKEFANIKGGGIPDF